MKYMFTIMLLINSAVVAATSYEDFVNNLPNDVKEATVSGMVSVLNNNDNFTYHLCLNKIESYDEAQNCIDLVFTDWTIEKPMISGCFKVEGEFKRFNSERVGLGWFLSKHGVLEVLKIGNTKC